MRCLSGSMPSCAPRPDWPVVLDWTPWSASNAGVGSDAAYSMTSRTDQPAETRQVAISNAVAEQAAIVRALMQANEKFLGARDAEDIRWAVVHGSSLEEAAQILRARQNGIRALLGGRRQVNLTARQDQACGRHRQ